MNPIQPDNVRRVAVWSARLRASHWLMAASTIVLLLTGWLMGRASELVDIALDCHYLAGYILIMAIALRLWLLCFGSGAEGWRDLLPKAGNARDAAVMLRFYMSLGRSSLPRWYAHNPLWGPIYLVWLALLAAQAVAGLALQSTRLDALMLEDLHGLGARAIAVITVAHIIAVILQDMRGEGSDVSAMISGYRIFPIHQPPPFQPPDTRRGPE
jgi:Ni/Fe-hydrogenase 1 B-type cytochrome subunit